MAIKFLSTVAVDTNVLYVDAAANKVGIGTTSPIAKLQIDSTSGWGVFTERGIKDGSTSTYSHNYGAGNAHILGRSTVFESSVTFSTLTATSTTKEYRFLNSSDKLIAASVVGGVTTDNNILVLSGSNVGIGTASPSTTLDVAGSITTSGSLIGPALFEIIAQYSNRGRITLNSSANTGANQIALLTNGNTRMVVNKEGNVGIGTTSPSEKLVVGNGNLHVNTPSNNSLGNGLRLNRPGSYYAGFEIATNDTVDWSIGANSSGFGIYENGLGATTRIIVKDGGNVGIGTTTPGEKLEVDGNIKFSNGALFDSTTVIGAGANDLTISTPDFLKLDPGYGDLQVTSGIAMDGGISTGGRGKRIVFGGGEDYLMSSNTDNDVLLSSWKHIRFGAGSGSGESNFSEKMRITSTGNVGIGTTSPTGKLDVKGTGSSYTTKAFNVENANATTLVSILDSGNFNQTLVGFKSTSFGTDSGKFGTSPYYTSFGNSAGLASTTNGYWTAVGASAGAASTTGQFWGAFGFFAGKLNTTGNYWNAIGSNAGENNTGGSHWIAIGYGAARYYSGGTTAASSFSNGVYIGKDAKVGAAGAQNEIVIGYEAEGVGSNSVVLGNDSIATTVLKGNVGIGTTSPTYILDVVSPGSATA